MILLLAIASAVAAPPVAHQAWSVADGLPVKTVTDLALGPDGHLWVTTLDGVVRFDGHRFAPVEPRHGDWPSRRFVDLAHHPDGALWLATEQGHAVRFADGRVEVHPVGRPGRPPLLRPADDRLWVLGDEGVYAATDGLALVVDAPGARSIARASDGLWVLAEDRVLRVDGAGDRAWTAAALGLGRLRQVTPHPDGGVWVLGLDGAGALGADRAAPVPLLRDGAPWRAEFGGLVPDDDGGLWVATEGGLFRWRDGVVTGPVADDGERPPLVGFVTDDGSGSWVVTRGAVLRDGTVVHRFGAHEASTRSVLLDPEGGLWLGTGSAGLHRLHRTAIGGLGRPEGLVSDNVYAVHEDPDGTLWVGAQRGGLTRWRDGQATAFGPDDGLPQDTLAVHRDRSGTLWAGGHDEGLHRRGPDGWTPASGIGANVSVHLIHERPDGTLWVGTSDGLYARGEAGFAPVEGPLGAEGRLVRAAAEAPDGSVWLGTAAHGVVRVDPDGSQVAYGAEVLGSGLVRALWVDDGGVWVGTEDRGLRFLASDGAPGVALERADGLPDRGVHAVVPDGAGHLWGSTNRGLFRVERAALAAWRTGRGPIPPVAVFGERDGMRDREGNGGTGHAAIRRADGRLAFASQGGVVLVDPAVVDPPGPPPRAHIRQAHVDGVPLAGPQLHLAPDQRTFGVDYTAVSFGASERLRFRHRLRGLQDRWVEAGGRRTAWFTEVPPGSYAFEVQALLGGAGSAVASRPVVVLPRWHERVAVRVVAALGGLLLVGLAVAWRFRRLRQRQRELQRLVDQRTAELRREKAELEASRATVAAQAERLAEVDRLKTAWFTDLSHELRTPLTLVMGPLADIRAGRHGRVTAATAQQLARAEGAAIHLFGLVNQLLDVVKLDVGQLRLAPAVHDLAAVCRQQVDGLTPLAERADVTLELVAPQGPVPVRLDPREFPKVPANLLTNAIKFTPAGGRVQVRVRVVGERVQVDVVDDGPGIPPSLRERVFERFYAAAESAVQPGSGLGLALARELTELHGGTLSVHEAPGGGSRFSLELPLAAGEVAPLVVAAPGMVPAPAPLPAPSPDGDHTTVLIVDDHAGIRDWIRGHLEGAFRVLEAADGEAGLEVARAERPDLVITDVMMPRMDGHALVRALRADPELDWLAIVVLTARGSVASHVEGLARGADVYLTKPFSSEVLVAQVRSLIAQRHRLRRQAAPEATAAEAELSTDARYLRDVRAAIASGHADPAFGVQALADALHQDRSHLYRRVKALTGSTPSALLRTHRLERAAQLLARRSGTVSEIAYGVGFNSVAYFSTAFRKHFGTTPSTYRPDPPDPG